MKKKKDAISLLLSLSLICTMIVPGTVADAENGGDESGMVISKNATANGDGTYTIELEAYATGETIITEVTEDVPTDIVLVLDQSGSMENPIGTVSFSAYRSNQSTNNQHYGRRHNGGSANLWYQLDEGIYATVSVVRQDVVSYSTYANNTPNSAYYNNRNNLHEKVGDEYKPVTLSRTGNYLFGYTYTYEFSDGTSVISTGSNTVPEFGSHAPLYAATADDTQAVYTYTYTDDEGATQTIGTSTGADTRFGTTLYQRTVNANAGGTRLAALKTAVTTFANSVASKAAGADGNLGTEDDVNHRIAVVGFASGGRYGNTNYNYGNTEVFVGSTQYKYGTAAQGVYGSAFQSMDTSQGKANISASIGALDADGGTLTNLGLEMANGILNANPVAEGEQRNRVIIIFTDGVPGWEGYDSSTANAAIGQASTAKGNGVTVYTVGIFSGADATSAGNANGTENEKANWFMQNLSSNNGTPQTPSYYLSASDADTLNSIFQQISDQIETGGSSTTLDEDTVIKDIIAPAFTLPDGATASNITLETYACTGKDGSDNYTWSKNAGTMGATAVIGSTNTADDITTDNQVSITGFDFAENYVGTVTKNGVVTYRGHKLVIKFTVTPRPGFFGGNGVATNTSAGVYENADATNPILIFPQPTVDVALTEPVVEVPDANAYLGAYYSQTVPEDAVKMGAIVEIGGYSIDFSKADDPDEPYGLEPWQVEYVNISISAETEGNGGSFENIQEDITYTVTVTVAPKTQGSSGDESATDTGTGTIHVFKPRLTFKDGEAWYGGDAPADFSGNLEEETWINSDGTKKHDDEGVEMLNEKPTLSLTYTPETGKIAGGKVNTKQDVGVDVAVKIGENNVANHTTFLHTDCDPVCSWNETALDGSPAFLLHVNTCTLEIKKSGGASDESYVFDVYKNGMKYSEVTVWGNGTETLYELPVGNYTIQENTGWSWRYSANNGSAAALTADSSNGTIICNNTKSNDYWLNGFSQVVRNIFGVTD